MTMVVFVCFVNDTKGVSQQANVCRSGETCSLRADDRQSIREPAVRSPQTQNSKTSTQNTAPSRSSYTRQRCELHRSRFHIEVRE